MNTHDEIPSHFIFGQHWRVLPEYAGYVPTEGKRWNSLKEDYSLHKFSYEKPLFLTLKKDGMFLSVYLCGFKFLEPTPENHATKFRFALCKLIPNNELIAIAW